ncbi:MULTISPECIES: 3,4-dihydroxyphenylacetate 2,3-dioxygenase [unclassified Aquimarina]|uniref:3,4-dihydroxyphenylacetate 2,3-dioxygenase n=2 Tax=Aquimarina TaxID=290174 RepID=UPI0018CB9629|nr:MULTISPECIES: 3,4-dihydroxyphenylacetate 2,3-dioxygenase [unclassified Aquimarina]MBG6132450.1 catechol 2,3-dioxygenase [Aquimarina sp. EL_35]MBG6152581.1 catechol 2,3-dioxygenase [Aquimarina sp. EL_32]
MISQNWGLNSSNDKKISMALVPHNFDLPFNIIRCSHVEYAVTDLEESHKFYVDILGLIETERTEDTIYLRGLEEQQHHSYILKKAKEPSVLAVGFKVAFEKDLDALKTHLDSIDVDTEWVSKYAEDRTLRVVSPQGFILEFYARMKKVPQKLREYKAYRGMHPQRFDHFNVFTPNAQETYEFFVSQLGFRLTEYSTTEKGEMWAAWMHRKGNVHDMALTNGDGPRLHHSAIWVPTALNIIHLLDVMSTTGYVNNIERGPGRHGVSNAFFLYILDPDGHRIEIYTCDYLTVDPDLEPLGWNLSDPQRQTLWGAPAPRSWFENGSTFINTKVKKATMEARPIIAD